MRRKGIEAKGGGRSRRERRRGVDKTVRGEGGVEGEGGCTP